MVMEWIGIAEAITHVEGGNLINRLGCGDL